MASFELSPLQRAIVEHRGGTLLVSAAAGSGKTRVLVERLMGFICKEGANVDDFLIITYTRAASAELRSRIAGELSERLSQNPEDRHLRRQLIRVHSAQISTVHSFCADLLRENAHLIDQSADFRVLEQDTSARLREQVVELTLENAYSDPDPERQVLFETLGAGRDDRALSGLILELFEQESCHRDPEAWAAESGARYLLEGVTDAAETIWGRYLMERLDAVLDESAAELERACDQMLGEPKLEKAYLPVFRQNIDDLRRIRAARTWDERTALSALDRGRLGGVRNFDDKELQERLQAVRKQALGKAEEALSPFSAPSSEALEDLSRTGAAIRALFALVSDFRSRYTAEKARIRGLDFSDLEQNALRLLYTRSGAPSALARTISERYREIMVDEYQDSNQVQETIFAAISRPEGNRFLVGDVKQSIYRFRLADPTIFLEKYRTYPISDGSGQRESKLLLSTNFRSRPEILDAVNDVFRGVMSEAMGELQYGDDEALLPGRSVAPMDEPCVELHVIDPTDSDEEETNRLKTEAAFVAGRIRELLERGTITSDDGTTRPMTPEDIVILLRAPSSAAQAFLDALTAAGIPAGYESSGDLLCCMEVQLLRAMLQVVDNPRQDIPLTAVLLSPLFCFTASELALIRAGKTKLSLYEALCAHEHEEKPAAFLSLLERFRSLRAVLDLNELTEELLDAIGLMTLLEAMPDAAVRRKNLEAFLLCVSSAAAAGQTLQRFLQDLDELEERGSTLSASEAVPSGVRILSVHASKGLEFPVVFLPDLARKFNLTDLREQVLTHPQWGAAASTVDPRLRIRYPTIAKQALSAVKEREQKSEEERVLYVAMTRARERLILSYCAADARKKLSDLAQTAAYPVPPQTAAEAGSPGDWILYTAISRMDAGALHPDGIRPPELRMADHPWRIEYHEQVQPPTAALPEEQAEAASAWPEDLSRLLDRSNLHTAASRMPAKLTATQLKGRSLDEELTDGQSWAAAPVIRFPRPDFAAEKALTATERGTAMHLFMQFADYARCRTLEGIDIERRRLVEQEFLTQAQADAADPEKLARFFASPLGMELTSSAALVREFKFSVLMPAEDYDPACAGEEVLLQGVVDCFLDEPDGLTILDFKTDRVAAGSEAERAEIYRGQLEAYSKALSKICGKPVKRRLLWFFATGSAVEI